MPRRLNEADRAGAALDAFQARPCTWCEQRPKEQGDHFCAECRAEWNRKREGGC